MNVRVLSIVAVALAAFVSTVALASAGVTWRGGGGWGPGSSYSRMYDPNTVETLSGEVISIDVVAPIKGMSNGVHLQLKSDNETIAVHLGPAWYLENQDVRIAVKDRVDVKGSRVTFDGKPALIAAEVHKGDEVLTLRDAAGLPAWSGWRRR